MIAALVGALVGGSFALLGSVIQHFLSLREDRIKREREEADKARAALRELLRPSPINRKETEQVLRDTGSKFTYLGSFMLHTEEELVEIQKKLEAEMQSQSMANSEPTTETDDKIEGEWEEAD